MRRFLPMIRRHVPLSRGGTERRRHLRQTETMLRGELGCDPHAAELAAALGIAEALRGSVPRGHQLKAQAVDKLRTAQSGVADIL